MLPGSPLYGRLFASCEDFLETSSAIFAKEAAALIALAAPLIAWAQCPEKSK